MPERHRPRGGQRGGEGRVRRQVEDERREIGVGLHAVGLGDVRARPEEEPADAHRAAARSAAGPAPAGPLTRIGLA